MAKSIKNKSKNTIMPNIYVASLKQDGVNNPVATVLENTIGNILWERSPLPGVYNAILAGAFPEDRTIVFLGSTGRMQCAVRSNDDIITITITNPDETTVDGYLWEIGIRIEVYP
jgi:hypothetical protein